MSGAIDLNAWLQEQRSSGEEREGSRRTLAAAIKKAPVAGQELTWSEPDWPVLREEALYGLAGSLVREIAPQTEADSAALLFTFLSAYGSALGTGPRAFADGAWHPARIWVLIVGRTSRSRKSTARAHVQGVMGLASPKWSTGHRVRSLSTGEGLIDVATDEHGKGRRLWVSSAEFSRILKAGSRDGNTLLDVMNEAWDGEVLEIPTATNPRRVANAHISVLGLITLDQLRRRLTDEQLASGFANRFMPVLIQRSQKIASPPIPDYTAIAQQVKVSLRRARDLGVMRRSAEAEEMWTGIYEAVPDLPGLCGDVTARAEAHMLRLQVTFAAMDGTATIGADHVSAAKAAWDYADASARYLFGDRTGHKVADELLLKLRAAHPDGLSHDEQRKEFSNNKQASELASARDLLISAGLAEETKLPTGGRPRHVTRARLR